MSFLDQIDRILANHITQLNLPDVFTIPNISPNAYLSDFLQISLAERGLTNDSNNCCLVSVTLSCHRMGIGQYLINPNQIIINGSPDSPILLYKKVLDALPCTTDFSLQMFVNSWNQSSVAAGRPSFGQFEDILIADAVIGAIEPYLRVTNPPLLTGYLTKFFCQICYTEYRMRSDIQFRTFKSVPLLTVPMNSRGVSPGQLLNNFLNVSYQARCPVCQQMCDGATFVATRGKFTVLAINRRGYNDDKGNPIPKLMTKLSMTGGVTEGDRLCGELVSVICHLGDGTDGGHWISYHRTDDGTWWRNNDSLPVIRSQNHPFDCRSRLDETVDFMVFKNQ